MAAASSKEVALRKRQQIDSSKKTMFIAVAAAAFVTGIALVVSFFLVQQMIFHTKIISAKQTTLKTIDKNIETADDLKDSVRALDANQALNSAKLKDDSSALQVILDALPSDPNADALGASLQVVFAGMSDGVNLEALSVDSVDPNPAASTLVEEPTSPATSDSSGESTIVSDEESGGPSIGFTMTVSGSAESLKELLSRFERSIRVVDLSSVNIQARTNNLQMILVGVAYYEPGVDVKLGEKVIKP